MSETHTTNPLVEQFFRGAVPADLRLIAAQGALPLKIDDLLELLVFLLRDADPVIAQAASKTLQQLGPEEILPVFKARETPPKVLSWGIVNRTETELRQALLQNPSTPDESVQGVAAKLPSALAELVVINQVRLLRSTPLLEALESNPDLSNDQKRRLRELRESFNIGEAKTAPVPPPPPVEPEAPPPEPEAPEPPPIATEQDAIAHYLTEEERGEKDKINQVQRIYRMTTSEKIITALKSTREERTILIRDPNRLVASAVLGSPRLTEAEIEGFSGMKNISEEVLRKIGSHRDWTKRYPVVLNLVKNPRTPLGIALTLSSRLNPRDMKSVSIDRNVPEVIRKHALRFVRQAHEPRGGKS